jgi:hypothetical protein
MSIRTSGLTKLIWIVFGYFGIQWNMFKGFVNKMTVMKLAAMGPIDIPPCCISGLLSTGCYRLAAGYVSTNGQPKASEVTQQRTQPTTVVVNAEAGEEFVWTETPDGNFDNAVTEIKTIGTVRTKWGSTHSVRGAWHQNAIYQWGSAHSVRGAWHWNGICFVRGQWRAVFSFCRTHVRCRLAGGVLH